MICHEGPGHLGSSNLLGLLICFHLSTARRSPRFLKHWWRNLRTLENVMRNKSLPRDVEETVMMKQNDLDQGVMIETAHLLRVWLLLHKMRDLLNIPEQEIRKVQHPHPGKMHEEPDMIGV